MTFPKALIPIGLGFAAFVSVAAYAESGLPVQHSDEVSSTYVDTATSAKTRGSERAPPEPLRADPDWIFNGDSWEPQQHAYSFSGGRLRHADNIAHDTPRPREFGSDNRSEYDDRN